MRIATAICLIALLLAGCAGVGRTDPLASASPTPGPTPTPPAAVMPKERAIALARRAVPRWAEESVLVAETGSFGDLGEPNAPVHISPRPTADQRVWLINLGFVAGPLNAQGTIVILDAFDGRVIQEVDWIS